MDHRSDLERLMTLSADDIAVACRGERLGALITRCFDEHLELSELADEAAGAADADANGFYAQEASAWRATAHLLRAMARGRALGADVEGAA